MESVRSASHAEQFAAERLETNLTRLRVAWVVGLIVHCAHVLLFQLTAPAGEPPTVARWRLLVTLGHGAMLLVVGATALATSRSRPLPWLSTRAPGLFTLGYLLFGAYLTAADQLITADTSPFTICAIGVALLVTLDTPTRVATLCLGTGAYLAGQALLVPSGELLLSNTVKGFSVAVVSFLVGTLFSRHQRQAFDQGQVIEHQRRELEQALAEARAAAAAADRANRAKSLFLATMSHEIRTPMTGVLGVADLLAQTALTAEQRELLATVQESGTTLVALISDLLDISKAEAGRLTVEARPLELAPEVSAVVKLFEPRAQQKGVRLELQWEGALPPLVLGDGLRVRQVLANLVGNALKVTTLGRVVVQARAVPQGSSVALRLAVVDTGPGISEEVLSRLFQPWTQGDERAARTYGGTGLGLVISRQLAETMGGHLHAQSVVGTGSTFTLELTLPLAPREATPLVPRHEAERSHRGGAPLLGRVLVVDDNAVNQLVAQGVLRQLGLEVEVAGDGAGAQALLVERPFDAVVTDLHMPGVDGLALVQWVRGQAGRLRELPVIVLTADLLPEERARCQAAGANAVMTKPFRAAELEACLRTHAPIMRAA